MRHLSLLNPTKRRRQRILISFVQWISPAFSSVLAYGAVIAGEFDTQRRRGKIVQAPFSIGRKSPASEVRERLSFSA
jgi:hypothetical protein